MRSGPGSQDFPIFSVTMHPFFFVDGTTHNQQCKVGAMDSSQKLLLHVMFAKSKKVKKKVFGSLYSPFQTMKLNTTNFIT
jgi:hypothetical protein